jgi:zinc/manganese transport system permease protein
MFEYDFMRTAFAASGIAAVVAGTVGFFLVLRGQTFAGHALSHVGFTGATGALLFGLSPLSGLVGFTLAAGVGMGLFGEKLAERDVAVGMMLSLALGLGLLFLHFYTAAATQAAALLFGNVLGVDNAALLTLTLLAIASLAALALIGRPLVFASLQAELAEARGVPLRFVSAAFLAIVAVAVAECAQIVGVLLVFTLMVGPAATAMNLTRRLPLAIALSAALALAEAWGGLTLAYYSDWPTSFWITALSGIVFFGGAAARRFAG